VFLAPVFATGSGVAPFVLRAAPLDAGVDFSPAAGTLFFWPGQRAQTVTIGVVDDSVPEVDEMLTVAFGTPTGGARVAPLAARVAVLIAANDDPKGVVGFKAATLAGVPLLEAPGAGSPL
jgi:hypothetical protein